MSTSVSGLTTNFFPKPQSGFTTTTAGSVSSGATSVALNSVAGYANGDIAVFVIDPTDASKKQTFTGVIDTSGVQVTSVVWTAGTNQTHALGATVVDYATATHIAMMSKGILVHANQDGTLKNNAITSAAQITDGIIGDAEMATAVKPVTLWNENGFDHVVSGCVWTADAAGSTRNASMTSGVIMLAGKRLTVAAVTARSFTASKDVYDDFSDNGDGTAAHTYTDNTTNAVSPALAAGSMRNAIVVVGATNIAAAASINQGQEDRVLPIASSIPYAVTDSLGNLICPRDPQRKTLGWRQVLTSQNIAAAETDITGLSVPVIVPSGRKILLSLYIPDVSDGNAGDNVAHVRIKEGATTLQVTNPRIRLGVTSLIGKLEIETSPTAGLHTYKATASHDVNQNENYNSAGSGAGTMFIKVELA